MPLVNVLGEMMKYCSWCSKDILEVKNRDDLCAFCDKRYWVKKNFSPVLDPERGYLYKDNPTDDEYRALIHMNTCQAAQEIMRKRISRMKSIIQAHWTPEQEQRRAGTSSKVSHKLHNYNSFETRSGVFLQRSPSA
jgi:hypothetical protein